MKTPYGGTISGMTGAPYEAFWQRAQCPGGPGHYWNPWRDGVGATIAQSHPAYKCSHNDCQVLTVMED